MRTYPAYLIFTAALLALIFMPISSVQAATLTVTQTGNQTDSADSDSTCSLIDAIQVANGTTTDSDCGAGDAGSDTIVLAGGTSYNIPSANDNTDGSNGLPSITTPIIIEGSGATINRTGASNYRIFHIAAGGDLTLNDVEVNNGSSTSPGGGIFNQGTLTINRSTIVGNLSTGNGGGIYADSGTINITNSTLSGNSATSGDGIYVNGGTVNANAVTIANQTDGVVNAAGTVNIQSSILDNLTNCTGTIGNGGNNLSSDATCTGFTTTTSGALSLGGLNLNSPGLTQTHMPGAGSSAIDAAGSCSTASDQRGVGRPVGTNCDIGAVEVGTPGFTINENGGVAVDEEGPTSDSYVVSVNTPPTSDVTFTITPDSQCIITSLNPVTVSSTTAGFNVDVQAVDDGLFETSPHTCVITHSATSADPAYNGVLIADVNVSVTDNDTPAVNINPVAVNIGEDGTTDTYTIVLATQPTSDVNLAIDTSPIGQCFVDFPAPSFNDTNWNSPQTITVQANNDLVAEGTHICTISHTASSSDTNYNNISINDVTATITDNDTAGIDVSTTTLTGLAEGGTSRTYTLTLDTPPADIVTIDFTTSPAGQCTILSPDPLEILPNTTGPFTVEVIAVDDTVIDNNNCTISHTVTSPDAPYNGISIPDVVATITDNDSAGLDFNPDVLPITEGGVGVDYQIFLNTLPSADVSITVTTDAQCTVTSTPNPVTITNGTLGPATVTITAVDDAAIETSPHPCAITHTVTSSDTDYNFTDTTYAADVTDNDGANISISDVSLAETNAGTTTATFNVTLSASSLQTITVDWATANGTATTGDGDYASASGTVTFNPGQTTQPVNITVNGDTKFEGDETFFVNLTNPTNASITDNQGTGTITNDDGQPQISIDDPSVGEGNSGQSPITFTLSLTNASDQAISVNWATADDTATTGDSDYSGASGTVNFPANSTATQTVSVQVNGDTKFESNETFFVNLTSPTNATIADNQGVGTITNDDSQPTISINSPAGVLEGASGTTPINFTVSLSNASDQAISVNWATADNTATTADSDYSGASGTVNFPANSTAAQTITVQVNGDGTPEADETFFVNLATPTNATIATGQGTGTILDDDTAPLPTLSIDSPPAVAEGDSGNVDITFTVTLSAASAQTVTVNWSTADNTATAGSDYSSIPALLTFNPGDLTQTLTVQVIGDVLDEADETFFVNLATPTNATITTGQGTGTITDDDAPPTLSIDNQTIAEGGTGTFTVTLSALSGQTVTVTWTTADNTATAGTDYTAVTTPQTLTFTPGTTTQTLQVTALGDTTDEPDETFFVNLATPTNATIATGQGTGTITDDDAAPSISINTPSTAEGNAGPTNLTFTLTLSNASSQAVTVNWTTQDSTATVADNDYVAVTVPTLVTFAPNTTTQTLNVVINGDTVVEADEAFFVNLATPTNATIGTAQGTGTILNDDALPTLSISDQTVIEGNSGQVAATFTVSLSAAYPQIVTVNWATADGTATTANSDYATNSGTVTFPANDATPQTVTVQVNGDTTVELDETFVVNLTAPANATILDGQGTGTISNDDAPPPTLSISDVTVTEGNSGQVAATFNVTLSAATPQIVTVNWATADGTATIVDNDYAAATGTVTFPANSTATQTVTVQVNGDTNVEPNENFTVNLNTPANATILDGSGTGTITNDDAAPPTVSISDVSVTEGNSGQVAANFNVTLSAATPQIVTVNWATADVSATTASGDYAAASGTVTFPANSTTPQVVTVQVNGDTTVEPAETFTVNLSSPANATILDGQGVGTITNDDGSVLPTLRISDASRSEGNSGQAAMTFSVSISSATSQVVTVNWATADGSATVANNDYAAGSGTLTFPANTTAAQTLTVQINGDTTVEGNQSFTVNLSNATNATIADAQGVGTIINDDGTTGTPTIIIDDISANEGNSGVTSFNFTLTRTGSLSGVSTVTVTTADSTATVGNLDYFSSTQTIQFPSGENERTFTVLVIGDTTTEPNESFLVNLSNVTGATIGDNQAFAIIVNDDGTTPGTTPTATPIPAVPPAPLCADLNGTTNPIIRAQVPAGTVTSGNVFCRILAENGKFVGGSPPETVGNQQVLSLGVIHAVDVYALSGGSPIITFNNSITVCLQGSGSMVYMDATQAPRPPVILTNATSDGTYTCANIPNAGTVVLVQSGGNLPGVNTGSGGSGGPSQDLSGCVVTPTMRLNLRSVPGLDGRVLTIVPEGIALGSSERTRRWFRVTFEGRTGWIFAAYVSTNGVCGE